MTSSKKKISLGICISIFLLMYYFIATTLMESDLDASFKDDILTIKIPGLILFSGEGFISGEAQGFNGQRGTGVEVDSSIPYNFNFPVVEKEGSIHMEVVDSYTGQVLLKLMPNDEAERIVLPIAESYSVRIVGSDFVGSFEITYSKSN